MTCIFNTVLLVLSAAMTDSFEGRRLIRGGRAYARIYGKPFTKLVLGQKNVRSGQEQAGVTCVPLSAVFEALNVTKVDLLSLDTEGSEPEILMTIPFHMVDIDAVIVECTGCHSTAGRDYRAKRDFLKAFFAANGYYEVYFDQIDFVYQKRKY